MNISLFMSAARPQWWERMYTSLIGTHCTWEIIAVGPNEPKFDFKEMPNFRYYKCDFKPTQCYAAASFFAKGELIGWTADDAVYDSDSLDRIWQSYQWTRGKPGKYIFAQSTIENWKDVSSEHYFFRHHKSTPRMAPMAFMNREWFWKLGGIDRNFVCGQYECDLTMRAYEDGGQVQYIDRSNVYLNHEEVHGGIINKLKHKLGKNSFRSGYWDDRRYLEECWVKPDGQISKERLLPLHPFNYDNILTRAQGPQGRWGK